jgi:hypothetical protein
VIDGQDAPGPLLHLGSAGDDRVYYAQGNLLTAAYALWTLTGDVGTDSAQAAHLLYCTFTSETCTGKVRRTWTRSLRASARRCPWVFFQDQPVPARIASVLKQNRAWPIVATLQCSLAAVLVASATRCRAKLRRAHYKTVLVAAQALYRMWHRRGACAPQDVAKAASHLAAVRKACSLLTVRVAVATGTVIAPTGRDVAHHLTVVHQIRLILAKYARRMYAACTACGRIPFFSTSGKPLLFCSGMCVDLGQGQCQGQCQDPDVGQGPCQDPDVGQGQCHDHDVGQGQCQDPDVGRGQRCLRRCQDRFCGRKCQRAHHAQHGRCVRPGATFEC